MFVIKAASTCSISHCLSIKPSYRPHHLPGKKGTKPVRSFLSRSDVRFCAYIVTSHSVLSFLFTFLLRSISCAHCTKVRRTGLVSTSTRSAFGVCLLLESRPLLTSCTKASRIGLLSWLGAVEVSFAGGECRNLRR